MNEPTPIVPPGTYPPSLPYKDRYAGLVIFGILTIVLGCICGLFAALMLVGQLVNAHNPNAPATSTAMLLPVLLIYVGLAVALVWIGIGSITARRWARALLLIFSWSWLVMGIVTEIVMVFLMPKMLSDPNNSLPSGQQDITRSAAGVITIIVCLILGFFFVLLPAVWVFFYSSPNVKATVEARDPVTRWTDACPLPLLAVSLWLWFGVPIMVLMPIAYHGVVPFFGAFITGAPGDLFYLLLAVVWAWVGWRLYRLDARAWWVAIFVVVLGTISSVLTYSHHDIIEMYQLMGYPQAQIEQMQKSGLVTGNSMAWITGCSMVPFLGYLLFVKKYLPK